jgi:conjugative relaxase-like TrwC/TraI family protein
VLSIGKMVAGSQEYYIRAVATGREEYYTGSGESPGYWVGEGARRLGLDGEIAADDLRLVLAGVSPNGEILTAGRVDAAKRVTGFDLTWSAPKSVSLLYGLSDPVISGTVRAVHDDAVTQALGYLERHAFVVRRGAGGERQIGSHGIVAAAFVHRTSRAGDPQLHTHVLVANVAEGKDGTWSAPDGRLIYHHARTAGFLYQAALRAGLGDDLGVRFGPIRRGMAELDGVDPSLLRAFSTRRREIEHLLSATGTHSARSAEVAALVTRRAKEVVTDQPVPGEGLRARWLEQVRLLGRGGDLIDVGLLDHVVGQARWHAPSPSELDELVRHTVGPQGVTAHHSAFERRDVVRALAEGLPRGAAVADVEILADRVLQRTEVVALPSIGRGAELRHTTLELLDTERALLETAQKARETRRGLASAPALRAALARFHLLSDEQVTMVERLTRSGAGVDVVVGPAGTGKTLALAAARASWETSGLDVLGTSLSARAARNLEDGAGIESKTLARLLSGFESGSVELGPGHVVVVDEAGMVGTRDLARLIEVTDAADAKLVLVGDPRQLPEIEAGGTLAALVTRIGAAQLTENRRQVDHSERFALSALRQGRSEVALATYQRAGRVHTAPSLREAQVALVGSWTSAFEEGRDAVMLAVARQEVAVLNELARAELRRSGLLGPDVFEIGVSGFALGDRVVCLRNDRRLEVLNGMTGTVTRPLGAGLIVSTGDGERFLPASYLEAGHLDHGYALTVHKAQGLTVDRSYVLATEAMTKEAGYVALSRARAGSELFVPLDKGPDEARHDPRQRSQDPRADLARRLATSQAKQLATVELETGTSSVARRSAEAFSSSVPSLPSQRTPEGRERLNVYREASQIEVGSGTNADEPTTDEAESLRRHRSLDDAIKLAHEARERVEGERDLVPSRRPTPEHDRSWGLSR